MTQECLAAGIAQARVGNHVGDIGHAVQQVAEGAGYGVVRELVGHGIGTRFHEEPQVPNYGAPKRGPRLLEGMTLAIEPMITIGSPATKTLADKWTVVTADGSLSAHFEHTVAITADGPADPHRRLSVSVPLLQQLPHPPLRAPPPAPAAVVAATHRPVGHAAYPRCSAWPSRRCAPAPPRGTRAVAASPTRAGQPAPAMASAPGRRLPPHARSSSSCTPAPSGGERAALARARWSRSSAVSPGSASAA